MRNKKLKWGRHVHARIPNVGGELHPMNAVCRNPRAKTFDVSAGSEQREVSCTPCRRTLKKQAREARRTVKS
jgi:hypothetical protein